MTDHGHIMALVSVCLLSALLACHRPELEDRPANFSSETHSLSPEEAAEAYLPYVDASVWTLARELQGDEWMRIWMRNSGGILRFRMEGSVNASAPEILSIIREVDLLPQWNSFCDRALVLRLSSATSLWAAAGVRLPWPIPAQALLVHAQVASDPQGHGLVAMARSERNATGLALPADLGGRMPLHVEAIGRLRAQQGQETGGWASDWGSPRLALSVPWRATHSNAVCASACPQGKRLPRKLVSMCI